MQTHFSSKPTIINYRYTPKTPQTHTTSKTQGDLKQCETEQQDQGYTRPLTKPAHDEQMQGSYKVQNRSVHEVCETSSVRAPSQFVPGVELLKKSTLETRKNLDHATDIKENLNKANVLLSYSDERSVEQALDLFQQILKSTPNEEGAIKGIGDAYFKLKNYNQAVLHLGQLSQNANAAKSCGDAYFFLGQYQNAIEKLETALFLKYTLVDIVHKTIGDSYYHLANYQMALESYAKSPNNPWAWKTKGDILANGLGVKQDINQAIQCYEKAMELGLEDSSATTKSLGTLYLTTASYEKAFAVLSQIAHKDPECAKYSADAMLHQQKYTDAIARYSLAVKLNDRYAEAYREMAHCFLQIGRREEAVENYKKILQIAQQGTEVYGIASARIEQMSKTST
ncbi:Tetratricopeptide repeat-containing protein [Rickettsiales endosymbiont of Paramecium tredecaurelia]|uniref:tetratricopeptide repeat protein n=1 Tax=Candidatus Sarmatiella mevalonica TaxID=2770581 RepID=UPI0019205145|nr:tetratricopeptide repeat protein [Candidatus Sarmatiella mevalonica]MBL3284707.1 Tetratricopeptide repeat-containing protein [Candidatus Sarmatiella mevalonica]